MAKITRVLLIVSTVLFVCAFFSFCVSLMYTSTSEKTETNLEPVNERAAFDPETNTTILTSENVGRWGTVPGDFNSTYLDEVEIVYY